jgi:hypothetical protein
MNMKIKITDELIARAFKNPYELRRTEQRRLERCGLLRKRGFTDGHGQFRYAWTPVRPSIGRAE